MDNLKKVQKVLGSNCWGLYHEFDGIATRMSAITTLVIGICLTDMLLYHTDPSLHLIIFDLYP